MDFIEFATREQQSLLRAAYALTGDPGMAQGLVQTVLTSAWTRWRRISQADSPEAYVHRMLFTQYVSWRRRRSWREAPSEIQDTSTDVPGPDVDLMEAIRRLPRGQRAIIVLRYLLDHSEQVTAELSGCSVGTVKSQTAKAIHSLRRSMLLADSQTGDLDAEQQQNARR